MNWKKGQKQEKLQPINMGSKVWILEKRSYQGKSKSNKTTKDLEDAFLKKTTREYNNMPIKKTDGSWKKDGKDFH